MKRCSSIFMFFLIFIFLIPVVSYAGNKKPRNIMLVFDIKDYNNEIKKTINFFFNKTLRQNDQLIIMTPANKLYSFSRKTLSSSRDKISKKIKNLLKKDTSVSLSDYRTIFLQMIDTVKEIGSGEPRNVKNLLVSYENNRKELVMLRKINEGLLLKFADIFKRSKKITGDTKNYIFLFFQKELRPIPDRNTMNKLRDNMDVAFKAAEIFLNDNSLLKMDIKKIISEFNKGGVNFNFIYINPKIHKSREYQLVENSGDIYDAMSRIAKGTHGITETTSTPQILFKEFNKK